MRFAAPTIALVSVLSALPFLAAVQVSAQATCESYGLYTVRAAQKRPTVTLGGTVIPFKEVAFQAELPGRVRYIAGEEGDPGRLLQELSGAGGSGRRGGGG